MVENCCETEEVPNCKPPTYPLKARGRENIEKVKYKSVYSDYFCLISKFTGDSNSETHQQTKQGLGKEANPQKVII